MKKLILSITALCAVYLSNAQSPAPVPNGGMETWGQNATLNEPQEPTGWVSANVFCSALLGGTANPVSVTQLTPAFTGSFSAQIKTVHLTTNPAYPSLSDTLGVLVLGAIKPATPYLVSGAPYTSKPLTFSFESMYTPMGTDSAYFTISLTKWTGTSRTIVTSNAAQILPSATWTSNTVTLNYLNTTTIPDTLIINFTASSYKRGNARPGSVLDLDALAFSGINGIAEYSNNVSFNAYPNPANSILNLVTDARQIESVNVYDITGKSVDAIKITADHTQLNTSAYASGLYFYSAVSKSGEAVARGKFTVSR